VGNSQKVFYRWIDFSASPSRPPVERNPESTESLSPFASGIDQRRIWQDHLELVRLATGERLFNQGDATDSVYFIESGELSVWLELPGAERAALHKIKAGECLGEMALYRHGTRTATVEAETNAVLWRLTADQLAAMEKSAPALAIAMHRHVGGLIAFRLAQSNSHLKDPLARLAQAIRDLAESEFSTPPIADHRLADAAQRTDEVGAIAGAIQFLQHRLQSYLADLRRATSAREQIESELRIAGRIQLSFLPEPLSKAEAGKIDFAAFSRPAREAGGDLYEGFFLDETRFFFVVGDVCGKGVPAALFMAVTAMCLRALGPDIHPVGHLLRRVNDLLAERNNTLQFVTLLAGVLNTADGELSWTNCGHPAPLIIDPDGCVTALDQGRGPPAGVFPGANYETQYRHLQPNQVLLVYTDGVTEALNSQSALYGEERLARRLAEARPISAQAYVDVVMRDVEDFVGSAPQADDVTLIAMRAFRTS